MRLEVRFSLRVRVGDWRTSILIRPWLIVDFQTMLARTKAAFGEIKARFAGETNLRSGETEEPS